MKKRNNKNRTKKRNKKNKTKKENEKKMLKLLNNCFSFYTDCLKGVVPCKFGCEFIGFPFV